MRVALIVLAVCILAVLVLFLAMVRMPGRSYRGAMVALTPQQVASREAMRRDVGTLAREPRNVYAPNSLAAAAEHIEQTLAAAGYRVERQSYVVEGVRCDNLIAELHGSARANEIVVIGAHYDSVDDAPGADDNASGVAAMLELARRFANTKPSRTIRFVAFVNEEPPHFKSEEMGSWRVAQSMHERAERVAAMLSLESIGYYNDRPGSQHYPPPLSLFYPSRGNFIAFAGNLRSIRLVRRCVATFRSRAQIASEGAALPELIQEIGWSDQWSFWQHGWPALMVTDTAFFRNPTYHTAADIPATLDFDRLTLVVDGLSAVIEDLAD